MNNAFIKFTQGNIDPNGNMQPLGRVYVRIDNILGFHTLVNGNMTLRKDGCYLLLTTGERFLIAEDVDEVQEELKQISIA